MFKALSELSPIEQHTKRCCKRPLFGPYDTFLTVFDIGNFRVSKRASVYQCIRCGRIYQEHE